MIPYQGMQPVEAFAHITRSQAQIEAHAGRQVNHFRSASSAVRKTAAFTPMPIRSRSPVGIAPANDFGARFEDADQLFRNMRVAAEDAMFGLQHHLLAARHESVQLLSQTFQRGLLQDVGNALGAIGDLAREPLGLSESRCCPMSLPSSQPAGGDVFSA
jgi:hypothetical protein